MSYRSKISSTTGLQRQSLNKTNEELELFFKDILNTREKKIHYLSQTLRSASTIYKKGGHVTMEYKDQSYSFKYDNKRKIIDDEYPDARLRDSLPMRDIEEALFYRSLTKLGSKSTYQKNLPQNPSKKYKSYIELGIRNFVKALFSNELNLDSSVFRSYQEIIDFIDEFNINIENSRNKYRLTPNKLALLKRRRGSRVLLPKSPELVVFVSHIKTKFPDFDEKGFYG